MLMILNTWIYVINVRASSALKPLLKKTETYSLDLKQVHIGKTRPNKTPGVSIWQGRVRIFIGKDEVFHGLLSSNKLLYLKRSRATNS